MNGEMMDKNCGCGPWRGKRWYLLPLIPIAAIFIFGAITMLLWNCVMPDVFKLGTITYWQAVELLILSKIFFGIGGFRKRGCGCRKDQRYYGRAWKEKWMGMSEEERAKFKEEWKSRCC
jgi:hypothetical protein